MTTSDSLGETSLAEELVYDGSVVHLYRETVRLPNGKKSVREVVRHQGAVAIVPLDKDGNIIMVRQYRQAARRMLLEIPAGGLEAGEFPEDCAIRELQEEIGFKPGSLAPLGGMFLAPGYSTEFIHLFVASDLSASRLQADADEFLEVVRVSFEVALRMILAGEIIDSKTISAVLMLKTRRDQADKG